AGAGRGADGPQVAGALGAGPALRDRAPDPAGRGGRRDRGAPQDGPHAPRAALKDAPPMAIAPQSPASPPPDEPRAGPHRARAGSTPWPAGPRLASRAALGRYKGARRAAIRRAQGMLPGIERIRPAGTAEEITDHLDQPAAVAAIAAR